MSLALALAAGCSIGDPGAHSEPLPEIPSTDEPSSARHRARRLGTTAAAQGYWEYLPPGYGGGQHYPLLVFLHGVGVNGNGDSELPDVLGNGPPALIDADQWPNDRPFVVLSPQHAGEGCPQPVEVEAFLDYAIDEYDTNRERVYLTGLSCGAVAAWSYVGAYLDERVAAMVPISGNGEPAWDAVGCELGRVPTWAFHGEVDEVEPVSGTIEPVTKLRDCSPRPAVDMLIYPGVGHDAWSRTYDLSAGHDIYAWMLAHAS